MRALIIAILVYFARGDLSPRAKLLYDEATLSLGGKTQLTDNEQKVNNCLMRHKFDEIDYAYDNPQYFNFSQHYFAYKNEIEQSQVYKIIRDMPKGAALHVHDMAILGPEYLMNITYMDHLYACFGDSVQFLFANDLPKTGCAHKWQLVRDARKSSKDRKKFDAELRKHFTMVCDHPDDVYPNIQVTWAKFLQYFSTVLPLLSYRPLWDQYFYDVLKKFREQNIMYVEVRSILPLLYELDGTTYDATITAKSYRKSINRFLRDYPDFVGAKLIYAPPRGVSPAKLDDYLATAMKLRNDVPEIFAGFDLVGPEDSAPLVEFVPQLEAAGKELDYFFHAGETDWYGTLTDDNIVDAILLGAKRLGHAYALSKHPLLVEEVKKRDIGLEVNVISNAVLSLVRDVRNHPLATFLAQGLPVVISSDDPGAWEADVISHDYYVAFVGVASRLSDLRLLKTLAKNSLKYSALTGDAKAKSMALFDSQWEAFVEHFDCSKYL